MTAQPVDRSGSDALVLSTRLPLGDDGATAALLTLNRPESLNAITWEMLRELDAGLDEVAADPSVRALLVTGAGRAFSAGGDLKAYIALQRDPVAFPAFVADVHRVFGRLRALRVPAIALVNGVAVAGGLELLLNCDLAFAAESASIGDGHLNFGQMGGGGSLTLLPRLVGLQRACELIFTGKLLTATEAESWGLVSRCVADDALLDTGLSFAQEVARKSPLAIANAKHVVNAIWADALALEPGLRFERERNAFFCLTSEDAPEGLSAFSEKRRPQFKGR